MSRMSGRAGRALVALFAGLGIAGERSAVAQSGPEPRSKPRYVAVQGHVVNVDQVLYVKQPGQPDDRGRTEVYFAAAPTLYMFGDAGKQLVAALLEPASGRAPGAEGALEATVRAFDGFDGKLALNWQTIRPDPTHVSLVKAPGKLVITTQRGSIHGATADDQVSDGTLPKNFTLIANPLAPDADFVATTCITGFIPAMPYQQAGLIVYGDDDNYLKWTYEYNWGNGGGQNFCCVAETNARPEHFPVADSESGLKQFWLRLTRRGNRYEYASSLDGKTYRVHGTAPWDGKPGRIGLLAKNGGTADATELDASFDFFDLRSIPR